MLFRRVASKAYPVAASFRGGYVAQRWVAQDHVVGASITASVASSSYAKQPGAYKTSHDRWATTVCFGPRKVSSRDYSAGLPVDEPELPARRIFHSEEPELGTAFRKYGRGAPEIEPRASLDSPNKDKDYNLWDPSVMNSGSGYVLGACLGFTPACPRHYVFSVHSNRIGRQLSAPRRCVFILT
jgi:hypothetical protein